MISNVVGDEGGVVAKVQSSADPESYWAWADKGPLALLESSSGYLTTRAGGSLDGIELESGGTVDLPG